MKSRKRYGLRSGVGLAAPQINISKRMIAVLIPDDGSGKSYDYMLVNPKIVSHSVQKPIYQLVKVALVSMIMLLV